MAISFPWEMYMQAANAKNQNRQNMYQDIAGIGQGVGESAGAIGEIIQKKKQQDLLKQLIQQMNTQGAPQQGPPLPPQSMGTIPYGQPMSAGTSNIGQDVQIPTQGPGQPTSGIGGPSQDNTKQIQSLMMKLDPQGTIKQIMSRQGMQNLNNMYPQFGGALTSDNMGQLLPSVLKQKTPLEWAPVSGALSDKGTVLEYDKTTGELKDTGVKAKSTGFGSSMGPIRQAQYTLQDLPSNQGPNTAGGAAYQVKVGARQGKSLIAKPGSKFRTSLASGDIARSINRVAPTDEAMKNAGFSDTLINKWADFKTRVTANPMILENPNVRKEMFGILDEMDKSATPFIKNQLDDMADAGFPVTPATRKRQLGENLPNIEFQESFTTPLSTGTTQGSWGIQKVQ